MRVLALDISSACCGWSILDSGAPGTGDLVAAGEVVLKKSDNTTLDLFNAVGNIIREYRPTDAVLEDTFLGPNVKTLKVLNQYHGVCILACVSAGLKKPDYLGAAQVRKAVFGSGKMEKADICKRLSHHFSRDLTTKGFDLADALALACAHVGITINAEKT
jgi:crossover junction endodeoxyribonuclease RuvC